VKQEVQVGQVDYTVLVLIRTTAGAPATALTEASVDIAYARVETDNDVTTTDVTPAALAALTTAHTDWGLEEVSATDHPGLYRLDIADAVFASGAWSAVVSVVGTGLDPCQIEFILVNHSPFSAVADILTDTGTTLQGELDAIEAAVADLPTNAELATSQASADDATLAVIATLQTSVDDLPTNAEIATSQAAADDATLAAIATLQTSVNAIDDLLDTEIPALTTAVADLPTNAELATALGTADDAVLTAIGDLPTNAELATALGTADDAVLAAIAALNNLSAAQVATEIADALGTDTYAEPTGVPAATATLANKLSFVYMALRNRIDVTATKKTFYDDGGAAEWEKDLSDDGTTYQESQGNAI